jgi:hypothetical protein
MDGKLTANSPLSVLFIGVVREGSSLGRTREDKTEETKKPDLSGRASYIEHSLYSTGTTGFVTYCV